MMMSSNQLFDLESIGCPGSKFPYRPVEGGSAGKSSTKVPQRLKIDVVEWDAHEYEGLYSQLSDQYNYILNSENLPGRTILDLGIDETDNDLVHLEGDYLYIQYYSKRLFRTVNRVAELCGLTARMDYREYAALRYGVVKISSKTDCLVYNYVEKTEMEPIEVKLRMKLLQHTSALANTLVKLYARDVQAIRASTTSGGSGPVLNAICQVVRYMLQHKKWHGAISVYSSTWLVRLNQTSGEYRVEVSPEQKGGRSIKALFFLMLIGKQNESVPFAITEDEVFDVVSLSQSSNAASDAQKQDSMSMSLKYCIQYGTGREVWRAVVHGPCSDIDAVVKLTDPGDDEAMQMAENEVAVLASLGNNTGHTPDLIFTSASILLDAVTITCS